MTLEGHDAYWGVASCSGKPIFAANPLSSYRQNFIENTRLSDFLFDDIIINDSK